MLLRRSRGHARRRSTLKRVLIIGGLLLLAVVVLALLALPMLSVRGDAQAAKAELTEAMSALRAGDVEVARERVAEAREHVDSARADVDGIGGDVWSVLPVAGTAVDDVRRLVHALDDATAVAEIGVDTYPAVVGDEATLFRDGQMDLDTLDRVIAAARRAGAHLESADEELSGIEASTPYLGDTIAANRDAAAAQVTPMAETWTEFEPMLDRVPAVFGAEGKRTYLIALLNPAELRYSGGAALSFAPMSWDQGKVELGAPLSVQNAPALSNPVSWQKVHGNRFRQSGPVRIANATFAPSWSVSGEELLRAWKSARNKRHDGVVAVDVVTLSRLFGVTGGITVPGFGEVTGDNLVETLIGSYDEYYPDATALDALNTALFPAFQSQLFSGGNYVAKAQALAAAADGRHFALYFRDDAVQEGFARLGLDGDLTTPEGDYLGVFTQNRTGSKVDYWQRRDISLDVTLADDGSATNRLEALVHNDTTPYPFAVPDPQTGYFTRWSSLALGVFLPQGVTVDSGSLRGEEIDPTLRGFRDHSFVSEQMLLEPQSRAQLELAYDVPTAATVDESGELTYRLAIDPQGMVNPESLEVSVHLPKGYTATSVPTGWAVEGSTLTFAIDALDASQEWEIVAKPSN